MAPRTDKYYLLSLGCSKNTVDSESIAQVLHQNGMRGVETPKNAEVLIVNTCGFIDSAKQESINALRELVDGKRGKQMVIAAGCLSQRYGSTLVQEVPGLDGHPPLDGYFRSGHTPARPPIPRTPLSPTDRCQNGGVG